MQLSCFPVNLYDAAAVSPGCRLSIPLFSVGMHAAPREVFVLSTQVYEEHFLDAVKNETVG